MSERVGPPRWLTTVLERRLPVELADAIIGDLHAEYTQRRADGRSALRCDLWFATQVVVVRAGALRRSTRRLHAIRPSPDMARLGRGRGRLDLLVRGADVRYAVRRMARSPGFTAVAILSLALGIGVNTAMFSLVNAVLLRTLPVTDPAELVEVYTSEADGFAYSVTSHPDLLDLRERTTVFSAAVGTRSFVARIDDDGAPLAVFGELVSWDYFQALGVAMELGRPFVEEEGRTPGTHPVAILGYRTWQRDHEGRADVLGRSIRLNGRAYTVVGVAPEAFTGSMPALVAAVYLPSMMTDVVMGGEQLGRRGSRSTFVKARLRPGVSVDQANETLAALSARLAEEYPDTNENRVLSALPSGDVSLHPAVDRVLGGVAVLLLAVVGLVLVIACANLASFLLARAEQRRREVAVRLALGAGRVALVRQLLVESTMLAVIGGALGVVLARWTVGVLLAFRPPLPVPLDLDIPLDPRVLLFTGGVSLLAGVAFGLIPALQATDPDIAPTLKNESTGGRRRLLDVRGALVVAQVAFSFVLLIGAGLFVRSLQKAQAIDPGFDTGPAAILWPMAELSGYDTPEAAAAFHRDLEERMLAHPSIEAVARADRLPLGVGVQTRGYVVPEVPSETPDGDHDVDNAMVSAAYFDVMGVDIEEGRGFGAEDRGGPPVAVVSRAFAERFYGGASALGRVITSNGRELVVVGVAADTKVRTLGEAPRPYVYEHEGQSTVLGAQLVIRGAGSGEELAAVAHGVLRALDPDVVLFEEPKSMNDHLALLLFPPRMAALLLSVFGGLALLLAAIGVYGVVSYAVSRRTREVGIRMSLGASAEDVVRMAVGGGMRLVAVGAVVGTALAGGVTWAISSFLFGIAPNDVVTFAAIPVLLTAVALLAAWVPARRASRVDPVRALRSE